MRKRDWEGVRLIAFRQEREEAYFKRNRRFSSRKRRADWKEGKERWEGEAERDERKRREREKEENDKQLRKEERGDTRQEEWDSCHRWKKRIRGCKESPLRWDEGGTGMREGEGDRREKRHRLRPCCIYHIITIIEPRTTRRHLLILHLGHPRPTTSLLRPLPQPQPQIGNSRIHFLFVALSSRLEIVCCGMSIVRRAC